MVDGTPGKGHVFGAIEPASGEALTRTYTRRTAMNWLDFLEQVDARLPAEVERVYAILDNLGVHRTSDVLLFTLHYPRWEARLPTGLCGLLEPDRAVRRPLVESAALIGAQGSPLRDVGRGRTGRGSPDRLLKQATSSIHLGSPPPA